MLTSYIGSIDSVSACKTDLISRFIPVIVTIARRESVIVRADYFTLQTFVKVNV